jgi:hypothetical protein
MRTNLIAEKIRPSQACEGHRSSGGGVIRHGFDQRYGVADIEQYPWQNEMSAENRHSGWARLFAPLYGRHGGDLASRRRGSPIDGSIRIRREAG